MLIVDVFRSIKTCPIFTYICKCKKQKKSLMKITYVYFIIKIGYKVHFWVFYLYIEFFLQNNNAILSISFQFFEEKIIYSSTFSGFFVFTFAIQDCIRRFCVAYKKKANQLLISVSFLLFFVTTQLDMHIKLSRVVANSFHYQIPCKLDAQGI